MKRCKRCGDCCTKNPCFISRKVLNTGKKCPALEVVDGKHSCGLYSNPSKYVDLGEPNQWKFEYFSVAIRTLMGIGTICEKNSALDLTKSVFPGISDDAAEYILWNKTAFPMAQTSILREQLIDLLINGDRETE